MKTNNYSIKALNNTTVKTQKTSRLDRIIKSSAQYMANFAVIRGNLSSFQSGSLPY